MEDYSIFQCKTRGGANPQGKPRVYFCCHPDDLEQTLDSICEDLFGAADCAVYYTEDMAASIPEKDRETDLGRMNLFVVPVTLKLLTERNRAMAEDVPYAIAEHIPVLPLMMEEGLEIIYSRPDRFGALQFLRPGGGPDSSEIPYAEKLKRFLDSVLISSETAERIRAAFDLYIFLSYRKKNRTLANELMHLIHRNPACRDIAVWYDEFLTPGENFNEEIRAAMEKSELFILLVTPELVQGENYIRSVEYPMARQAGKPILPVEASPTDRSRLQEGFEELPEVTDISDEEAFRERLLSAVGRAARQSSDDPVHTYLIGLAYLDGIDVETDRARALELITRAAEADLQEAMEKLLNMYYFGKGVELNYHKALFWCQKMADLRARTLGEEHPDTLEMYLGVAFLLSDLGEYGKALEWNEKIVEVRRRTLGEEHPDTLIAMHNLASVYGNLGDSRREAEMCRAIYKIRCRVLGEHHPQTLGTLNNLAVSLDKLREYDEALEILEKLYEEVRAENGEDDDDTLSVLGNLAMVCSSSGDNERALALQEKCYAARSRLQGAEHPDTLHVMFNMITTLLNREETGKALSLAEKTYDAMSRVLGENHPDTLAAMGQLASCYAQKGDHEKELIYSRKVYEGYCRALGEDNPRTLEYMTEVALAYKNAGEEEKAIELYEKACDLWLQAGGEEEPYRLVTMALLAESYLSIGDTQKAGKVCEAALPLSRKVYGEEGSVTQYLMLMMEE